MRTSFLLGILILFCQFQVAQALTIKTIDELHPLSVTISAHTYNRIAVKQGGIKKVIVPEGLFTVQIDEITGQAFITPTQSIEHPVALSIITDNGYVQDLVISLADQSPEVILLKEIEDEKDLLLQHPHNTISHILGSLIAHRIPQGYIDVTICETDYRETTKNQLQSRTTRVLEGPYERVVYYTLRNIGTGKIVLQERFLQAEGDLWIYLGKELLEPMEETNMIIGKNRV